MVAPLATYVDILRRGITLCDALSSLYEPDVAIDWANRTLRQTSTLRMSLTERLTDPQLTLIEASTLVGSISHYLDSHWADYQEVPKPDPAKHVQVVQLHAGLEALMNEMAPIYNALRAATTGE